MKTYRVYRTITTTQYVDLEAESEQEAREEAEWDSYDLEWINVSENDPTILRVRERTAEEKT